MSTGKTNGRRVRRRLAPDARRQEILRAATRRFATQPYTDVLLDDIAGDVGASRGLINHYFGDKRGLFLAVSREIVERVPRAVRADRADDVEAMVEANTAAWLDMIAANRETALIFLGAGPFGLDPELEALQDELRDRLAERILANHLGTLDPPAGARLAMRAATGMMERALRDWILGKGVTREQTHTIIAQTILAVMRHVVPAVIALDERP